MKFHIKTADYEQTGGGCITAHGKTDNDLWYVYGLDSFMICDEDLWQVYVHEGDTYEWEKKHMVMAINDGDEEYIRLKKEMADLLRERYPQSPRDFKNI